MAMKTNKRMRIMYICAIMFCMGMILWPSCDVDAKTTKQRKAMKAYTEMMKYTSVKKFAAVDVNRDGVKELITWKEEGIQDLFTFYKGKVIRLNTYFGNSNNVYYNRAKKYIICDNSGSAEIYSRYRVVKDKARLVDQYEINWHDNTICDWLVYQRTSPKGDVLETMSKKKFWGDIKKWKKMKFYRNTIRNRSKYL